MIHVLRPYPNEEEYLACERFSIDSKSMLLIEQPPLPLETVVVFDVQLANGSKPIRAEARVIGHVAPSADQPGGLRVRFKRFGAATKAFIDRAIARSAAPIAVVAPERPTPAQDQVASSGIHRRPVVPVTVPVNREELLERLRSRARGATQLIRANHGEQAG